MAYDFPLWKERVDDMLKVIDDPDDSETLERVQEALAIGHEPDPADQVTIAKIWDNITYGIEPSEDEGD